MDTNEINEAIEKRRAEINAEIAGLQGEREGVNERIRKLRAHLDELPRPRVKRTRKAKDSS